MAGSMMPRRRSLPSSQSAGNWPPAGAGTSWLKGDHNGRIEGYTPVRSRQRSTAGMTMDSLPCTRCLVEGGHPGTSSLVLSPVPRSTPILGSTT